MQRLHYCRTSQDTWTPSLGAAFLPPTQRTIAFCSSGLKPVQFSYSPVDFTHDSIELDSHSLDTLLSQLWFSLFCTGCTAVFFFFTYLLWLNMLSPTTTPPSLYLSVKKIKLAFGDHITCISKCKWQHLSSRNWKCTGGNDGTKPANHGCSFLHWFWEVLIRFQCRILTFSFKMPVDSIDPLVLVLPMFDISYSYDWHVTLNRSAVLKALVH